MANLVGQLLSDLGLSEVSLQVFQECGIQFYELITYTVEDFESSLGQSDVKWNVGKVFEYVNAWRKRNKTAILRALSPELLKEPEDDKQSPGHTDLSQPKNDFTKEEDQEQLPGAECRTDTPVNPDEQVKVGVKENCEAAETVACEQQAEPETVDKPAQSSASDTEKPVTEQESCSEDEDSSRKVITFTTSLLLSILTGNEEGKSVIEKARICELSESNQHVLAGTIARFHLKHKNKLRTEDLENYWLAIKSLFKFERKENYFICRSGQRRNHGGKIANKVSNLKQKKRKTDLKEEEHCKQAKLTVDAETSCNPSSIEAAEWLTLNQQPWSVVLEKWKTSSPIRKKYLQNQDSLPMLFSKYSHFKTDHGYQLVDIDFNFLSIGCSDGLSKLESAAAAITTFIAKKATDPSAEKLLKYLTNSNVSQDAKLCALILGLNTVLPPNVASAKFKPTICVAQEDTVIFVNSCDQIVQKVQSVYTSYVDRKLPISPKLVAVGTGLENLTGSFYVVYSDLCYEFTSFARAVDVLIKTTHLFGLPYSKISKLVWHFVSSYIYGIKHRESYASVNRLQNFLTQSKDI